jgi:hypothetical protein
VLYRHADKPAENALLFLHLPYVCPEPVLAK